MVDSNYTLDRRDVLAGVTAVAVASAVPGVAAASTSNHFPRNFRWGVATAAHQIEGNNVNSDLWLLENITPTTFAERSGDACDSYHRYEEDIALLARLGFNTYRFSIEWARIEPSRGHFSNAALDYYKRVIACCRRHNVDPAVTFYHFSAPSWFAAAGGWLNPDAPALFANFCSTAARALAGDMAFAFTLNEPNGGKVFRSIPGAEAYFASGDGPAREMHAAAARAVNSDRYVTNYFPDFAGTEPNLIAGHEQSFSAIKAENSGLPVGVTIALVDFEPGSEDSPYEEARRRAYGAWMESCRRAGDFVGVQNYHLLRVPGRGAPLPPLPPLPYAESGPVGNMQRPEGLRNAVEFAYAQTRKPIFVTENGMLTDNDEHRIAYTRDALAGLQENIAAGVPLIGYLHWSLLDNFEWESGYAPKFGLVAVDRTTFLRTPKPSAAFLGRIARRNRL